MHAPQWSRREFDGMFGKGKDEMKCRSITVALEINQARDN